MKKCKEKGFFTGICFIPVLSFLSDSEEQVEETIKTVKEYGADFILVGDLTLFGKGPADCETLYYKFLEKYYPELVPKYKSLYRIFLHHQKNIKKSLKKNQGGCVRNMELKIVLSNGGFGTYNMGYKAHFVRSNQPSAEYV